MNFSSDFSSVLEICTKTSVCWLVMTSALIVLILVFGVSVAAKT